MSKLPERLLLNAKIGPDGRIWSSLNGCLVHKNVCDVIRWPDGTIECLMCAGDRQPEATVHNAAFHMKPYWEWVK